LLAKNATFCLQTATESLRKAAFGGDTDLPHYPHQIMTESLNLSFADRLCSAMIACGTPAMVGLDPRADQLPVEFADLVDESDPLRIAAVYKQFCREIIDVVAGKVAIVKPQAAFFEELGPAGMAALAEVIGYAREKGLLVLSDGKRGDIGSTAVAYARGYLGEQSPWQADALTINPYLGDDTLQPFIETAKERDAGLFVLVKTSNPGSGFLQDRVADGTKVCDRVAAFVEEKSAATAGSHGFGVCGAVVGATYPAELGEMREKMPHTLLLVPGFGAQGGTAADIAGAFREDGLGAVINNSRKIIFAHKDRPDIPWQQAVEAALLEMIEQIREVVTISD
jgi:orotidine-5'-phosphate decarboxylase